MKNFTTFYEAQTHQKKYSVPTRQKFPTCLKQKFCYGDIQEYTDICFKNAVLGRLEMVHVDASSVTNQKYVFCSVFFYGNEHLHNKRKSNSHLAP